ncbi:MAG: hypothetical protein AAGC46_17955 [Solirubrobacteraceae bacterium]|nr:hypothetical protein [Patulibacter sp.]
MRLSPPRTALAAATLATVLGGTATTAQAATTSPFGLLSQAKAGSKIVLSPTVTLLPGKGVTKNSDGTVTMPNSTVQVGSLSGTGVTAKATSTGLQLLGGVFAAPTSITENTLKAATTAPVTVAYDATTVTGITGQLQSTTTKATSAQQDTTIGPDLVIPADAVPASPTKAPWSFKLGLDLQGLTVNATAGYAYLTGRIYWTTAYSFSVGLSNLPFNGGTISAGGTITGSNIFHPPVISGLSGSIQGPIQLAPKLALQSAAVKWDGKGIAFDGAVQFGCTTGTLLAHATGQLTDLKNFSFHATGLASACTLGRVAEFDEQTFLADVTSTDGSLKYDASFSAGTIQLATRWLTKDADLNTYLSGVSAEVTNSCDSCGDDGLELSFTGTGVVQTRDWKPTAAALADPVKKTTPVQQLDPSDRTSKTSFKFQTTVSGTFAMNGGKITKTALKLKSAKFDLMNELTGIAFSKTLVTDTTKGFTTPAT